MIPVLPVLQPVLAQALPVLHGRYRWCPIRGWTFPTTIAISRPPSSTPRHPTPRPRTYRPSLLAPPSQMAKNTFPHRRNLTSRPGLHPTHSRRPRSPRYNAEDHLANLMIRLTSAAHISPLYWGARDGQAHKRAKTMT